MVFSDTELVFYEKEGLLSWGGGGVYIIIFSGLAFLAASVSGPLLENLFEFRSHFSNVLILKCVSTLTT